MDRELAALLQAHRLSADGLLAFLAGPSAPTDWRESWTINDRIAHLVQDAAWCAAVAGASQMGHAPHTVLLRRLLAHEERVALNSSRGIVGTPDYWGDLGQAVRLRPEGCTLDISLRADGSAKATLKGAAGSMERVSANPAAAACFVVLSYLAKADPLAESVVTPKPTERAFVLRAAIAA